METTEKSTEKSDAPEQGRLPGWLKYANRVAMFLQRLGLPLGTIHTLSTPGRVSGKMRSTPVSTLTVDGQRYIVGGMIDAGWVKNARAAGWGMLAYGRWSERVSLVEVPQAERVAILRAFPREVPQGVRFFQMMYDLPRDPKALPAAFAGLADRATVFRVEPAR